MSERTNMYSFYCFTVIFILLIADGIQAVNGLTSEPSVTLTMFNGKEIMGNVLISSKGRPYHGFQGIRYAKPPINQLRFKPPLPADPWHGVLNATQEGAICPQPKINNRNGNQTEILGDEDCLFLNIYTPKLITIIGTRLPVLLYIHGGGFIVGSGGSQLLEPEKFMDNEIIVVTINYRLGPLGFLSTGDASAHGNYGMLDQVLALRWVKENIGHFGGDVNRITILGNDAGGVSVTMLLVSPITKGLFHAAIAQSGSVCSNWSLQKKPQFWTKWIANKLKCSTASTLEMIECLRRVPVDQLIRSATELQVAPFYPTFFGPVMEVPGGGGFLTENPMTLLKEGRIGNKVPYITGITRNGGHNYASLIATSFKTKGEEFFLEEFPLNHLPNMLDIDVDDSQKLKRISRLIKNEYFANQNLSDEQILNKAFAKTLEDMMFGVSTQLTLTAMANLGIKTYAYRYTYDSKSSFIESPFEKHEPITKDNEDDSTMSDIINHLWMNFAETKTPTIQGIPVGDSGSIVEWTAYTSNKPNYLELSLKPTMRDGHLSNRTEFWTKTIQKQANARYLEDEL